MLAAMGYLHWSWLGFALPLGLNAVEGTEAALLVAAGATRGGWRRALLAPAGALLALIPFAVGLYFLFQFIDSAYIDYGIAGLIFLLGANEVREGLGKREEKAKDHSGHETRGGWGLVWPAFAGVFLEGGEAVLYTFGVAHGSAGWVSASAWRSARVRLALARLKAVAPADRAHAEMEGGTLHRPRPDDRSQHFWNSPRAGSLRRVRRAERCFLHA